MITIIKDKEPIYDTQNYDVVLVGVSTHNMLMGNFQGKMGVKYPIVNKVNDNTPYGDLRKLGKRITIDDIEPIISLMYICTYPSRKDNFIDYDALEKCLKTANAEFKGKKVMTTLLGSTRFDGKGDREKCLKIIEENTKDLNLFIYDSEQITFKEEIKQLNKELSKLKKIYPKEEVQKMNIEMRQKAFLPIDLYCGSKKNKEDDEILNF